MVQINEGNDPQSDDFFYKGDELRWIVELSDGKIFTEKLEDPGAWRNIMEYANLNNLSVKSFEVNGEELDPHPATEGYFVINDMLKLGVFSSNANTARLRKGFGSVRKNGKVRIRWITVMGNSKSGDYTDVLAPEQNVYDGITLPAYAQ